MKQTFVQNSFIAVGFCALGFCLAFLTRSGCNGGGGSSEISSEIARTADSLRIVNAAILTDFDSLEAVLNRERRQRHTLDSLREVELVFVKKWSKWNERRSDTLFQKIETLKLKSQNFDL